MSNVKIYLATDGIYKRVTGPEVDNKKLEFLQCMQHITGRPFNACELVEDWVLFDVVEDSQQCICSKHIKNLCVLRHKPTNKLVQVGCVCINKANPCFKTDMNKKLRKLKQGYRKCRICKEPNIDADEPHFIKACKPCYCKERGWNLVRN